MYQDNTYRPPDRARRGKLKTNKIPVRVISSRDEPPRKPHWIRAKAPVDPKVTTLKKLIRENKLHTVCEEASCPNLGECFKRGTATFMILGDTCTRRCPFCDVAHGRPRPPDDTEPANLARAIRLMRLNYVVITSVDRDDLLDRGAGHFVACIEKIRQACPEVRIEILVPDFRSKIDPALNILGKSWPDVFNHNLETVPRLYPQVRPGADYQASLSLLEKFKAISGGNIPAKSGLMLGLGERPDEVRETLRDLRAHGCDMVTLGQYLQPSRYHLPVARFVHPDEFAALGQQAEALGFINVASAPMVRSSYHADLQAVGKAI